MIGIRTELSFDVETRAALSREQCREGVGVNPTAPELARKVKAVLLNHGEEFGKGVYIQLPLGQPRVAGERNEAAQIMLEAGGEGLRPRQSMRLQSFSVE
jgi:hypothetical protein